MIKALTMVALSLALMLTLASTAHAAKPPKDGKGKSESISGVAVQVTTTMIVVEVPDGNKTKRVPVQITKETKFTGVTVGSFVNRYPLHYWLKLLPLPARLKPGLIRFSKAIQVGYIPLPMPAGNMAVIGYRPR